MGTDPVDDFLEAMSHRLNNEYESERPQEHPAAPVPIGPSPEEAEARKELMERVAAGQVISTTLFYLDEDPHVQRFYCENGHLMGAVTAFQNVVIFRSGPLAQCLVCGLTRKIPDYVPMGDEPPDLLEALAVARTRPKETPNGTTPKA